jgi:hypothetical protein
MKVSMKAFSADWSHPLWAPSYQTRQSNKGYETNNSAYGPVIICNLIATVKFTKGMTLNEIRYNPPTSTFLSVVDLTLKSSHTQHMLLRIKSSGDMHTISR